MTEDALAPTQGLEALKDSIGGLESRSAGFLERKVEVERVLEEASQLKYQLFSEHSGLENERFRLIEERERLLRAQLASEGLAVCAEADDDIGPYRQHHSQYEDTVWGSADPLRKYGVFSMAEMTMVYSSQAYKRMVGGAYGGWEIMQSTDFRILCPAHAPNATSPNYSRPSKFGESYGSDEWTRINVVDGKLVRELDGKEIHTKPRQGHLDQGVYEHFGYPGIPDIPDEPWR